MACIPLRVLGNFKRGKSANKGLPLKKAFFKKKNPALLTYATYHTIHPFEVDDSMIFSNFTDMCNHHQSQFLSPPKDTSYPLHPASSPAATHLLSVSIDSPSLDFHMNLICELYFLKYLYWSIIALQCCDSFCFITK